MPYRASPYAYPVVRLCAASSRAGLSLRTADSVDRLQLRGNDIGSNRLAGLFVTTRACPTVESNRIHHGAVGPRRWAGVLCRSLRCVGGLWHSVRREVVGLWLPCRTGLDNGIRMTKGAHGVVRDNDVYAPSLCKDAFHTRQTLRTADQRIS